MKKKKAKFYRKTALKLFDELMMLTVEDITKNADICKRYEKISNEYFKKLEKPLKKVKIPKKELEESRERVFERIIKRDRF